MEVARAGKLQVVAWALALWLSGVESSNKGGRGRSGPLLHSPIGAPFPAPNIHVKPYPVPPPPCPIVTKHITKVQLVDNYVPIYETQVQPVIATTTFYHTSFVTQDHEATSILYTTIRNTDFEYESSEAVVTHQVTVTGVQKLVVPTTVTSISLTVEPQVTTLTKTVKQGRPDYFTEIIFVTRTVYDQPRITVTENFPLPYDNTYYEVVTETHYVTETVQPIPRPPVTSTVIRTEHSYTPVFVTVTVDNTVAVTTTVQQPELNTVVVEAPCITDIRKGFGGKSNSRNSYGPY